MAVIWGTFLLGCVLPFDINTLGLTPRTLVGLVGIPATPFLHANLQHLLSNTVPLFVLLTLLAGSNARSWKIVIDVVLLGGLLLWIFGRNAFLPKDAVSIGLLCKAKKLAAQFSSIKEAKAALIALAQLLD